MNRPRLIASFFGAGYSPLAPGTAGSLAALPCGLLLLWAGPGWLALAAAGATLIGFCAIPRAGGADDPGWVVIDEVAGLWITLLGVPHPGWRGALIGFALFRLLDVTKPGPIGWADRRHGAFGVMADDVIAGAIGAVLIAILVHFRPAVLG